MARKKEKIDTSTVLFDVFYEAGGDDGAKTFIMDQDRKIATMSGKPPREISRIVRSGK
jgi:hypothetical protein